MNGRILIVAGSDSGGGAGIQADIKTVTALNGFAMTAVTALTAQNTEGVKGVYPVPPAFVAEQIKVVMDDLGADVIKTGMLVDATVIEAVADALDEYAADVPRVIDPVMVAKGGHPLLAEQAVEALKRRLLPNAAVLTPNVPEAEILTGQAIKTEDCLGEVGRLLLDMGPGAVLMKGGHLDEGGDTVVDLLVTADGVERFESHRLQTRSTHGTGCTTASAIACGLAQGLALNDAVVRARDYVHEAIRSAPGFGRCHGPLNHAHALDRFSG